MAYNCSLLRVENVQLDKYLNPAPLEYRTSMAWVTEQCNLKSEQ
jgi:hypothetical protein